MASDCLYYDETQSGPARGSVETSTSSEVSLHGI